MKQKSQCSKEYTKKNKQKKQRTTIQLMALVEVSTWYLRKIHVEPNYIVKGELIPLKF